MSNRHFSRSGLLVIAYGAISALCFPVLAQPPTPHTVRVDVTAISVTVQVTDRQGRPVTDVAVNDVEVLEDGQEAEVVALQPILASGRESVAREESASASTANSHIALYFDRVLAAFTAPGAAARVLGSMAAELSAIGQVEIVVADPRPVQRLALTQDAAAVRRVLAQLGKTGTGENRIVRLRREYLGSSSRARMMQARFSVAEEAAILALQRDRLLDWATARASVGAGQRLLFLLTGGYDLDPSEFYLNEIDTGPDLAREVPKLRAHLLNYSQGQATEDLAQGLAAAGWRAFVVSPSQWSDVFPGAASQSGRGKLYGSSGSTTRSAPRSILMDPLGPWHLVAEQTGGGSFTDPGRAVEALREARGSFTLTYQVPRPAGGRPRRLEIRARRHDLTLRYPRWVVAGSALAIAEARARALLAGGSSAGELPVVVVSRVAEGADRTKGVQRGSLEARLPWTPILERAGVAVTSPLRVTVALGSPDGGVIVRSQEVHGRAESSQEGWVYEVQIDAPSGTKDVAIVVEHVQSGLWGAAKTQFAGPGP